MKTIEKYLRHSFFHISAIYMITELQSWGQDSKLEIFVQKVRVKKWDFYSYVLENISDYVDPYPY